MQTVFLMRLLDQQTEFSNVHFNDKKQQAVVAVVLWHFNPSDFYKFSSLLFSRRGLFM